jgi:hypothetical protein
MFNDNASDIDRQKKLEELIRRNDEDDDKSEEEKETEIPTFEQINEMLARSDDEYILFNKMDREMYEREGRTKKMEEVIKHRPGLTVDSPYNYRLIQEWEVPEWIKVKPQDDSKEMDDILNLGKRVRKTITNIDNLTDQ